MDPRVSEFFALYEEYKRALWRGRNPTRIERLKTQLVALWLTINPQAPPPSDL